jgi:cell division protein FtsL
MEFVMYNGNLAYELELPAPVIRKAITAKPNSRVRAKGSYKASSNAKMVCMVLAVFAIAFSLCWRYVAIFDQTSEIERVRTELARVQAQNSQIQMEIERATERSVVVQFATNELGMVEPDKSQFVYMMPKNRDRMQHLGNKTGDNLARTLIAGVVEYFQ